MIDTDKVIRRIWQALETKSDLPMRRVTFRDGSAPEPHRCEQNVLRWTSENPENEPVHRWLAIGLLLQKDWMVRDQRGAVFNMTPLDPPSPMFTHPGSLNEFRQLGEEIHLVAYQHLRL